MKVAESAVQQFSEHTSVVRHQKSESLSVWGDSQNNRNNRENRGNSASHMETHMSRRASFVKLSQEAMGILPVKSVAPEVSEEQEEMVDLNIRILQKMFEKITGRKMTVIKPQDVMATNGDPVTRPSAGGDSQVVANEEMPRGGLVYDYYESHYEYESTSFSSVGKVVTEDGKEIDFSVELNMSREFYTEQSLNIRMGDALKDPLVVNFGGSAAELTQTKFSFDIDADGQDDQVAFVKGGSGFLALDKNGDNRINDGSELFGPKTGAGFAELAEFDEDNNGWIDENDAIFSKLRIWIKDESGDDQLFALGQKGIGALYLGHVDTPFTLKNNENELLGQVRSSGVFLNENGSVGTLQQVDLAV